MTVFMDWLRVELLRLRSLDWGTGSKSIHWLKDGVAKFSAYYSLKRLAADFGISEHEILGLIESPPVLAELEGKSFAVSWEEGCLRLSWLEEGLRAWNTDLSQDYFEEDGRFYARSRIVQRVIYLDNTARVVSDSGEMGPVEISEEAFMAAQEQVRRNSST